MGLNLPRKSLKELLLRPLANDTVMAGLLRTCASGGISVLMYHEIGPDDLESEAWTVVRRSDFLEQITYLRRHFDIVSVDQAIECLKSGRRGTGKPLAVLTFDDGDANNHELLLPIVEDEKLPVTIYVATAHIVSGECFWFDQVINALQVPRLLELNLAEYGLPSFTINARRGAENWSIIDSLLDAMKSLTPEARKRATQHVVAQAGTGSGRAVVRPLSIEQVRHLGASRYVTIGAHTHGHDLLTQVTIEEARSSIVRSRQLLQEWSGQPVDHFAYPNGFVNSSVAELVRSLGFRSAVASVPTRWTPEHDLMRIPRFSVGRYDSLNRVRFKMLDMNSKFFGRGRQSAAY